MTDLGSRSKLDERLEFVGLTGQQLKALSNLAPTIIRSLDQALDKFYAKAKSHPETARFFASQAHIDHAKQRQVRHWETIAAAKFDDGYVGAVTKVGQTHARLGLEPRWYIGGYALILENIVRNVIESELRGLFTGRKSQTLSDQISAVIKAALVDMDYAISVYLDALAAERQKAEAERQAVEAEQQVALEAIDIALSMLAKGDLTSPITAPLAASFASLKANYNQSISSLNATLTEISRSASEVFGQSEEISNATEEMAKRTENQASALEESAAALEEISTISKQAQVRTADIQNAVSESVAETIRSSQVVEQAVNAMSEIEQSSQRMTQIIGVIDEIAFQTNLLALNAGVEAARAGDSGRGFAVVAQEVRELAQRSATAAREIKELISRSTSEVSRGVGLVNSTGEALKKIGARVQSIDSSMSSIANSTREQSSGISEINTAVGSMDMITQRNAAMVEETSAATVKLSQEARRLSELVGSFKISGEANAHYRGQGLASSDNRAALPLASGWR